MTKTNVLSEQKQAVLATLYLIGVRSISVGPKGFSCWKNKAGTVANDGSFMGSITYEDFSLTNDLSDSPLAVSCKGRNPEFNLKDLIREHCPNYKDILSAFI